MNPPTTSIDNYTLLLGTLMPLAIAIVVQSKWTAALKAGVALAMCFLAAAGQLALSGQLTPGNALQSGITVAALSMVFYGRFWKPTGIAPALSAATDVNPSAGSAS